MDDIGCLQVSQEKVGMVKPLGRGNSVFKDLSGRLESEQEALGEWSGEAGPHGGHWQSERG